MHFARLKCRPSPTYRSMHTFGQSTFSETRYVMNLQLPGFLRGFVRAALTLAFTACCAGILNAQAPVDYDDVVVIVNENSEVSKEIAAYFAEKRSIPERNILRIDVPERETITDEEFQNLRAQVEAYLAQNDSSRRINYLVLTKGVPIRINRSFEGETAQTTTRASVDNELTLLAGTFSNLIGNQGWASHPYVEVVAHFNRSILPIFLVTRLDAYTREDVFRMIDNGGPNTLVNKDSALFVLDRDPTPIDPAFDQSLTLAAQVLRNRGWRVNLDSDTTYVTGERNVLGYASWGSNDNYSGHFTQHAIPHNTWSPGALAETFVSTSGRSLQPGTSYGQSLIADWLAEGVVGAKGYVFEPFTVALALPHVLFDRYTDETQDTAFNLAESFYMASRTLSWMDLVLGDPKTSIITSMPALPNPVLPPTTGVCVNEELTLRPSNIARGAHNWFAGDTAEIAAAGLPYDDKHPMWIGEGRTLRVPTLIPGTKTYTYVNTNVAGDGFAQVVVRIGRPVQPEFGISADTVNVNEAVTFTDETEGEGARRWLFGDGETAEDTTEVLTHTYRSVGIYTITLLVNNNGCLRSAVKTIIVRSTTGGVENEVPQPALAPTLLPNPTEGATVVSLETGRPGNVVLRIYDPNGRLLGEERSYSTGSFRKKLSLEEYPSGVYLIEVTAGDRKGTATVIRQ